MKNYMLIFILLFATTACASAENYSDDAIRTLLPFDAIPAITDPQFVSSQRSEIRRRCPRHRCNLQRRKSRLFALSAERARDRQRCCGRNEHCYHVVTTLQNGYRV